MAATTCSRHASQHRFRTVLAAATLTAGAALGLTGCTKPADQIACESLGGTHLPLIGGCAGERSVSSRTKAQLDNCALAIVIVHPGPGLAAARDLCRTYNR